MRAFKALLTLSPLGVIGCPVCADAQAAQVIADPQANAQAATPADQHGRPDDIVITGTRDRDAKVPAESEFDENQIAAQGADSIQNLLTRLAPFVGDDAPVILINGRPAGFDRSILSYPAEALSRLAILKPQAAAVYGAAPGKRVVNLVLKPKFSSLTADAGVNAATAGGQQGNSLSVGRTAILGDTRWNIQLRYARDGALLKSARNIPPAPGAFDGVGYVSGVDGGEIDLALSSAAGDMVMTAAIPSRALSNMPTIDDFVATANRTHAIDPNDFDSLLPSRRAISLNADITRPLGTFFVTLTFNADSNRVQALRGLPMASIVLPAGSPWSPFGTDVLLTRPFAGTRALRNDNDTSSLGTSLTLNGTPGGWQTSFGLSYLRNWSDNVLETGVDTATIQQSIDSGDPAFNPYGPWGTSLLTAIRSRTSTETLGARFNVQKKIVDLPAGSLFWNIVTDASHAGSDSWQADSGTPATDTRVSFDQVSSQSSLTVPLLRRSRSVIGRLGDLSVNLWIGAQAMTRTSTQTRVGGGLNWSPIKAVQFNAIFERAGTAPSFDELDAPITRTVARVFDYSRQEVAEPVWITGGNPDLQRGSRQTLSLSASVQPAGGQKVMFNMTYRQTVATGGSTGFPQLSPAIEAAFPDRVTRDAAGNLIAVDARAINIARDTDASLLSGIMLRFAGRTRQSTGGARSGPGDPLQITLSLNHNWHLKSQMLIRPGVPVIDRLNGGTGTSRHMLMLQLGAGKRGIGASFSANWSSAARIDTGNGGDALRSVPGTTLSLSTFMDPDQVFSHSGGKSGWKNLHVSLSVDNLLNNYTRVTLKDGTVPPGFSHDEIDPLGRTVRLTVRKRF